MSVFNEWTALGVQKVLNELIDLSNQIGRMIDGDEESDFMEIWNHLNFIITKYDDLCTR